MTFTHENIQQHLIDFLYGDLDADARVAFEAHLATCSQCRDEVGALQETRSVARQVVRAPLAQAIPPGVHARIMDAAKKSVSPAASPGWVARLRAWWTLPLSATMFATVAAVGVLLLGRETIFREARRPLGENPSAAGAPKAESAKAESPKAESPEAELKGSKLGRSMQAPERQPPADGSTPRPTEPSARAGVERVASLRRQRSKKAEAKVPVPNRPAKRVGDQAGEVDDLGVGASADVDAPLSKASRVPSKADISDS
ncbi:MAG: zf-HC2 domain-containing protein, partial [Deltaproteobacteria bacterium]|nr:zf-HC2 domain-containing protein [Deltaproteobacteria bacterium]